jgi:predicted nucleic acid-binding protein
MTLPFLDTNVFLRHLCADHPVHSPKATTYLTRIEEGEFKARTADTVIFETVFTLQRFYQHSKPAIRDALLPLIELPGIVLPGKQRFRVAFDLYVNLNLPFADAYHATLMQSLKLTHVVSFDKDFDRIPGLTRVEPA